ncbi:MAG: PD-(D/E)XK nuclease family protein [Pseudomonadota bacterium]
MSAAAAPNPKAVPRRASVGRASVWTIHSGQNFADALVAGLLKRYGDDALTLADITLLLPNRRAVGTVQTAFLRAVDARATLLPRLSVLGEELSDDVTLASDLSAAPIAPMQRIALLSRLIAQWEKTSAIAIKSTPAHTAKLARSLARFLDQCITEGLDFAALDDLVPEELAHHWQDVLSFLKIVTHSWPDILAARDQCDGAYLRRTRLEQLAERWRKQPPTSPIIAAGSTGSIPATACLLKAISRLPQGHVVLPGLNQSMPDEAWDLLEESHPQGALKRLLSTLEMPRADVTTWHDANFSATDMRKTTARRLAMIDAALSPAEHYQKAIGAHVSAGPLPGLRLAEVDGERQEATVIALVLREALETPGKTAALITPDRTLARHVSAQLKRWDIEIDDSAGVPLDNTPPTQFMRLIAEAMARDWAPAATLALFKHPFFMGGIGREEALSRTRRLDLLMRGPRRTGGLAGLMEAVEDQDVLSLLKTVSEATQAWPTGSVPLAQHLAAHMALSERLAGDMLFAGPDGHALAQWCEAVSTAGFGALTMDAYAPLLSSLMEGEVVRSVVPKHPRLAILGTIEARMTQADVMILGGLNEGVWPPAPSADPWMSEPMRVDFGLPPATRRIGLSAHDFVEACGAPEVWLTRTTKSAGAPTLAARWLARLKAAYGDQITRAEAHCEWAARLDEPAAYKPMPQPRPKPPTALRPRQLSVSDIERWMRDPYALYAAKILRLKPLEQIDEPPGAADRGSAIHAALEGFFKASKQHWPEDPHARLMAAGEAAFAKWRAQPGVWALWWPRFTDVADWVLQQHAALQSQGRQIAALETKGAMTLEVCGETYEVHAKADRLDISAAGLVILDYKTGGVPDVKDMARGFAPQLPIEGLIAQANGFAGISQRVNGFEYWALSTTTSKGPQVHSSYDTRALMEGAKKGLETLFQTFAQSNTAYLHAPSPLYAPYKDYADLAREEEWRDVPEAQVP